MRETTVVITGLGPVTPIGIGREAFWSAALAGVSGVAPVSGFDASAYTSRVAAEITDFHPESFLGPKELRNTDRFTQFAVAGTQLALADAGLAPGDLAPYRTAVVLGCGVGGVLIQEQALAALYEKGPQRVRPTSVVQVNVSSAAGEIALAYGFKGPNLTVSTACSSANNAIGLAADLIRSGRADVAITGGTEAAIAPLTFAGFACMRALSTRNDDPRGASRPFDKGRDGFVMGEGAGILILESLEHARARGATPYAEVAGYATVAEGYHMVIPNPDGTEAAAAIRLALEAAGVAPEEVDYVSAHGTSTHANDCMETRALKMAFGQRAYQIPVNSLKSMTGHTLGAASGIEAIACALSIKTGWLHPTINYQDPDPECDLD
ncbi:MAG TPA: beta-ketoacyl-ACP synthase II, partial [Candidatus Sulfotelmatobacter sp.]|nr:beta-ketoacyl-ACP synthase II [Candidatus Sulfotelmatobacter sp.]